MTQRRVKTFTLSSETIAELKRQADMERLPMSRHLERLIWENSPKPEHQESE